MRLFPLPLHALHLLMNLIFCSVWIQLIVIRGYDINVWQANIAKDRVLIAHKPLNFKKSKIRFPSDY
jgi:hypothetical protein